MTHLEIVNPLPSALAHYQSELVDVLESAGAPVQVATTTSAERAGTDRGVASVLPGILRDRLLDSAPAPGIHRLVLWPVLGYPELMLWRGRPAHTSVVVHDPTPLRRQVGLGPFAVRATHALARLRPLHDVIVHSTPALAAVRDRGYDAQMLPHPMLEPETHAPGRSKRVLVLGQHKDTRDVAVLEELAPLLRARGLEPVIVGRGWPDLSGWDVDSRFVSEDEFRDQLRDSAVLLLPYTLVYQSGVAVRAAEAAVPVVAARDTNVRDLYGDDWPGLVDHGHARGADAWAEAVDRVLAAGDTTAADHVHAYRASALAAWRSWVDRL
jgi:hypothetical protein